MNKADGYALIGFVIVILLNILISRYLINRALKKIIIPELKERGFNYLRYKWAGFFGAGNFKDQRKGFNFLISSIGKPFISIYIYVYFDNAFTERKTVARIDTIAFFIKKVVFDDSFQLPD